MDKLCDLKILVVDDSSIDRMIIQNMLSEYKVITANNGEEALVILRQNETIHLMILDLNMPVVDGYEVLRRLTEEEKKRVRILILTNYDEMESEFKGLELGAVDYIRKPIHIASLTARIRIHAQLLLMQRKIEKQLSESERSKAVFLSHIPGLAYRCRYDREWTMEFVSTGCETLTGYKPESLLHNKDISFNQIIAPEYRKLLWELWESKLNQKEFFEFEYEIITASGQRKTVLELGEGIYDDKGNVEALEGIIFDITHRKNIEKKLQYQNEHDRWTGLYNRNYLEHILAEDDYNFSQLNRAVILINLIDIHQITTSYGFHYTRDLLQRVAMELKVLCTDDCMLFNTYENRFAFYHRNYIDQNELNQFIEKMIEQLDTILAVERVGGGIGVVELEPGVVHNVDKMLKRLLIASEKAIEMDEHDFDVCYYNSDMEQQILREQEIKNELSKIEQQDDSGFSLVFQPILDLKTNQISGFEALARLNTSGLGNIPPLEFIPIAEKYKYIIPIGKIVIQKAIQFLKRINDEGFENINMSVNASIIELLKKEYGEYLSEKLQGFGVDPKNISIEITETVFSSSYQEMNTILGHLQNLGIHISIDDFGTGYSSFARERDLNVDCLKVDKSFVDRLMELPPEKAITGDIISMAHKLGHSIIAEGVEYSKQLDYLRKYGCDKVQGYFISKPLNEDEALEFIKNYKITES